MKPEDTSWQTIFRISRFQFINVLLVGFFATGLIAAWAVIGFAFSRFIFNTSETAWFSSRKLPTIYIFILLLFYLLSYGLINELFFHYSVTGYSSDIFGKPELGPLVSLGLYHAGWIGWPSRQIVMAAGFLLQLIYLVTKNEMRCSQPKK